MFTSHLPAAALVVALATGPAFAFSVDMAPKDLRGASGQYALEDLAVGESGFTRSPILCTKDGKLFVGNTESLLPQASDYAVNWRATRQPGDKIAYTAEAGKEASLTWQQNALASLAWAQDCSVWASPNRFEVVTINGFSSASEISASKTK